MIEYSDILCVWILILVVVEASAGCSPIRLRPQTPLIRTISRYAPNETPYTWWLLAFRERWGVVGCVRPFLA